MRKVSIKQALLDLSDDLTPDVLRNEPRLIRWAIKASSNIGGFYDYKRTSTVVTVSNCNADIPLDAVHVLYVVRGDHGCSCENLISQINSYIEYEELTISEDVGPFFFYWKDANTLGTEPMYWEIQGDNIVFASNYDNEQVTIIYLAHETDAEGLPIVHIAKIDAIVAYLEWKLIKNRVLTKLLNKKNRIFPPEAQLLRELKRDYHRAVRNARVEVDITTDPQYQMLVDTINNPLTGHGCYLLSNLVQ